MPAATTDNLLVLPRIPRPDPAGATFRPVREVIAATLAMEGGPELATLYGAIAAALALMGPGRYSLDRRLGIRASWQLTALALVGAAAAAAYGMTRQPSPTDEPQTSRDENESLVVPQSAAGLD